MKWEKKTLGEIINLKRGYDLPSQKRKFGYVPIISSSGITDFHIELAGLNEEAVALAGLIAENFKMIGI